MTAIVSTFFFNRNHLSLNMLRICRSMRKPSGARLLLLLKLLVADCQAFALQVGVKYPPSVSAAPAAGSIFRRSRATSAAM